MIPHLESRAKASLAIISVSIQEMVGRSEDFMCPRRCLVHGSYQRRSPRPFPEEVLSPGSQFWGQRVRNPGGLTFGTHRILMES